MSEEILLITADSGLAATAKSALRDNCEIVEVGDTRSALDRLGRSGTSLVIVDGDLPADDVAAVIESVAGAGEVIVVVREHSVELLARGALTQVPRSSDGRLLAGAVERLLRARTGKVKGATGVPDSRIDEMIAVIRRVRHDMNNPLTSIMAEAQLMLMDADDMSAEQRRGLETIEAMAVRIRDLTQLLHDITVTADDD